MCVCPLQEKLREGREKVFFMHFPGEKGTETFWLMEEPLHCCWGGWAELAVIYLKSR